MKTRTKGILFFTLVAVIMLASGVTIAIPADFFGVPNEADTQIIVDVGTGIPLDNYPPDQQDQYCGTGEAISNRYVKEYKIPTACTQPLAITTDPHGTIWFAQTNSGNLAKFDPLTEKFTEFDNAVWDDYFQALSESVGEKIPARSMMWGIDYSSDGSIWYTDGYYDALWKFSISEESYDRLQYPNPEDTEGVFPQKLTVDGSRIIVNDLLGSRISFFEFAQVGQEIRTFAIPSPMEDSITSGFTIDSEDNVWYTTWIPQETGILVKFDYPSYEIEQATSNIMQDGGLLLQEFIEFYQFPTEMSAPNGVTIGPNQKIWIADTSGNFFFSFDPETEEFTKYVTSIPHKDSYGNLKLPTYSSNPYWIEHYDGNLVMNEHNANRIAVFNPESETMVEYTVPSRNPNWSDCEGIDYCGLAQVFDFTVDGSKIWFTEWVENNIGVVDTSTTLPFSIDIDNQNIILERGETAEVLLQFNIPNVLIGEGEVSASLNISSTASSSDLIITSEHTVLNSLVGDSQSYLIQITAGEDGSPDTHKVLLGAFDDEIAISKFITVTIV